MSKPIDDKCSNYIGPRIRRVSNLLKRQIDIFVLADGDENVTGIQKWIIGFLYRHMDRDMFQKDIEAEFRIRRSTASEIMKLMERNGFIIRESVDYDARLKKLVLTDKAKDLELNIRKNIEYIEKNLRENISDDDINTFFKVIDQLETNINNIEEEPQDD